MKHVFSSFIGADCDWRALGEVVVDTGATIDLNGHELKVSSVKGDNLKARVTSSASNAKLAIYNGSVNANNLTVDNVTVATTRAATPTSPTATTFFANSHSVTLQCATGLWSNAVEYVNNKVVIDDRNEFSADNPSNARNVIIETKATFNSMAEVVKTLTSDQFAKAHLLNENIMDASYSVDGWGSFEITDVDVGDEKITVKVKLVRNFAVTLADGETAAPINGTLKIYGGQVRRAKLG